MSKAIVISFVWLFIIQYDFSQDIFFQKYVCQHNTTVVLAISPKNTHSYVLFVGFITQNNRLRC